MTELLTAAQMRAIEQAAIESEQVTGLELMERAGAGVVQAVFAEWPEFGEGAYRAIVLCGPGNNGGDGFVVARLLHGHGWNVEVFLYGDQNKLPPDAKANCELWRERGDIFALSVDALNDASQPDLLVDAVFGIGLTRPLPDMIGEALFGRSRPKWPRKHRVKRVAVDCPSGIDMDNGLVPGEEMTEWVPSSDLTVTFHTPKLGHYLALGPALTKRLRIVDIGLRGDAMERSIVGLQPDQDRVRLVEAKQFGAKGLTDLKPRFWPVGVFGKQRSGVGSHKYDHGHIVVFAGALGRGGAARLAARAALRSGAGLVTVVCPKSAVIEHASHLTAVMLRGLDPKDGLDAVVDDRVSGFCVGPGLGVGDKTRARVLDVLRFLPSERQHRAPVVVLDADALTSFAPDPSLLFDAVHSRTVLTPHEGEFAALFPDLSLANRGARSKVDVVRAAAARAGCIVLLKGHDTVIAAPNGAASVHAASYEREVNWLATAGAGDVLAGFIAGLAGQHLSADVFCMVETAAWLHVECARAFGPGLIAEDLPDVLPQVLRDLGA